MAFSDQYLDLLRASLPVSSVVARKHKLRKQGTEYRAVDNKSLTVNDQKRIWWDHGSPSQGAGGGDIFDWFVKMEGLDFPGAVEECSRLAGVPLPDERTPPKSNGGSHAHREDPPPPSSLEDYGTGAIDVMPAPRERDNITATYDYTDASANLLYQVCRLEWEREGKKIKTFMQRRPGPDGSWIWALAAGDFIKSRTGDWYLATDERVERWKGAERRAFPDAVPHGLYRLVEFRENAQPDEPVFIVEGEKDADTLIAWEFVATTNSGGAKNFRPEFAQWFRGLQVVIATDNDDAGRARGEAIARILYGVAASVRVMDFGKVWPEAPKGGDVTDWKNAGGTPGRFLDMVGSLALWTPGEGARFKLVAFNAVALAKRTRYLVRGLIPRQGMVIVWGPPKCGKSFWIFDLLMHVALGWPYRGRHTEAGPVVYLTLEGHEDFNDRIEAFKQERLKGHAGAVDFFLLATRIDLVKEHQQLIDDIRIQMGTRKPTAVCVDTINRSLRGSESSDQDMAAYVNAATAIAEAFGAVVILVHHCGLEATRPRGHTSLTGAADAQIKVSRPAGREGAVMCEVEYMKGGPVGEIVASRLRQIEVGRDEYNFAITSLVVEPEDKRERGAIRVNAGQRKFLDAVLVALDEHGVAPSGSLANLPRSITKIVDYDHVKAAYAKKEQDDGDDPAAFRTRLAKALQRARNDLQGLRVIACEKPFIWITGRPVVGMISAVESALTSAQQGSFELPDDIEDFR